MLTRAAVPLLVLALASSLAAPAEAKSGRNAALLGGLAVGAVGGAILGNALSNNDADEDDAPPPPPAPRRVYVAPQPVYVAPPPPPPRYVPAPVRPAAYDYDDQAFRLHDACDDGDRRSCVRFGILIGQHRERQAEWRRTHPDFFDWEN